VTATDRRPYSRHGLTALRQKVRVRGFGTLDQRTAAAKALHAWRNELLSDLGGDAAASASQKALVDVAVRTRLFVESLDAFLMEQESLVNKKKRAVLPCVLERQRLADSLVAVLSRLGLERRAKPVPSLEEYLNAGGNTDRTEQEAEREEG
jgi:hypothetical protein